MKKLILLTLSISYVWSGVLMGMRDMPRYAKKRHLAHDGSQQEAGPAKKMCRDTSAFAMHQEALDRELFHAVLGNASCDRVQHLLACGANPCVRLSQELWLQEFSACQIAVWFGYVELTNLLLAWRQAHGINHD